MATRSINNLHVFLFLSRVKVGNTSFSFKYTKQNVQTISSHKLIRDRFLFPYLPCLLLCPLLEVICVGDEMISYFDMPNSATHSSDMIWNRKKEEGSWVEKGKGRKKQDRKKKNEIEERNKKMGWRDEVYTHRRMRTHI